MPQEICPSCFPEFHNGYLSHGAELAILGHDEYTVCNASFEYGKKLDIFWNLPPGNDKSYFKTPVLYYLLPRTVFYLSGAHILFTNTLHKCTNAT